MTGQIVTTEQKRFEQDVEKGRKVYRRKSLCHRCDIGDHGNCHKVWYGLVGFVYAQFTCKCHG